MDSKTIEKEFDRWWNTFKNQATRQYPVKAAREAWAACAMLMADEMKDTERACSVANDEAGVLLEECRQHSKEIDTLQSKLDEATEIIKTISKNANHYDKIDLQNKCDEFLSSLDKPIKEEK